ncbi:MAG: hypothetical protein HQ472_06010 [Ignavibacteria bacterium]|nr:hypothetical protein [Ignavibacteria bacterium]
MIRCTGDYEILLSHLTNKSDITILEVGMHSFLTPLAHRHLVVMTMPGELFQFDEVVLYGTMGGF